MVRLGHRGWCQRAACAVPEAVRPEGGRLIVVLDSGGVEGLAPIDEQRRARLRVLREHASDIVVPAAVLAEGMFTGNAGHDYHVRRLLDMVDIAPVEPAIGYSAGSMRRQAIDGGLDPAPSGVDVIVAAEADARAARDEVRIVTSDGGDFEVLASLGDNVERLSVLVL